MLMAEGFTLISKGMMLCVSLLIRFITEVESFLAKLSYFFNYSMKLELDERLSPSISNCAFFLSLSTLEFSSLLITKFVLKVG